MPVGSPRSFRMGPFWQPSPKAQRGAMDFLLDARMVTVIALVSDEKGGGWW